MRFLSHFMAFQKDIPSAHVIHLKPKKLYKGKNLKRKPKKFKASCSSTSEPS